MADEGGGDEKYVSERAGKRYPVLVGIIGVLFFFAQMVVPAVAMFAFMPGMFMMSWEVPRLDSGAVHQRAFYYPVKSVRFEEKQAGENVLYRFEPGTESPEKVDEYRAGDGYLVSVGDDLWVVSRSRLLRLREGRLRTVSMDAALGEISRPFAYEGHPAVVESRPGGYWLRIFREGAWREGPRLDLAIRGQSDLDCSALDAVAIDGVIHFFLEYGDGLYHRRVDPDRPAAGEDWEPVTGEEHRWSLTVLDDAPVVFYTGSGDNAFRRPLRARRLTEAGWETMFELPDAAGGDLLVTPGFRSDWFDVMTQDVLQGPKLLRIEGGSIRERVELGQGFMAGMGGMVGGWMISLMTIVYGSQFLLPVVLVIIVSYMMYGYRVTVFSGAGRTVPYASLLRRAIARGIDLLLLGLPILVGGLYFMVRFVQGPDPRTMIWFFVLWGLGMVWALVVVVVFSFLEGRWGKTPGKWVTGIRVVGTDLEFCGFGRAIIRNLLMFVDGFFNFLVGVLMIALTEHWQRLGDYAADTVVVRDGTDEAGATTEAEGGPAAGSQDPEPPEID